jgi:hypothetical protein
MRRRVIPDRLDRGNHPFSATSLKGEPHQRTRLKSRELPGLLYRKGHLHGRHETRNWTVVQGHYAFALVERHYAALSLETRLGLPCDCSQMQIPADGGQDQHPAPTARARLIHCYASVKIA